MGNNRIITRGLKKLLLLRKYKGFSIIGMSREIGIPYSTYHTIETGKMKPGLKAVWLIREYSGGDIDLEDWLVRIKNISGIDELRKNIK